MTAHPSTTFLLFHPAGPSSLVSRGPPSRSAAILHLRVSQRCVPSAKGPDNVSGLERRRRKLRNRYRTSFSAHADCRAIMIRCIRTLRGP